LIAPLTFQVEGGGAIAPSAPRFRRLCCQTFMTRENR